jgi:GT2 family glycosyltransferase
MKAPLKVAVGIATAGRRELLTETLHELSRQTRLPDVVIVCPARDKDLDRRSAARLPFPFRIVRDGRGSCVQRNAIIDVSQGLDVLAFFDDDFIPGRTYLEELDRCFTEQPEIVVITGNVIADGIKGPGLDLAAARAKLLAFGSPCADAPLTDTYKGYGCNMAVRLAPIHGHSLRFDEDLPLYGWLEDVDLCRRLSAHGRIVKNWNLIGVHLGNKRGRAAGIPLGYSQIANPIYLWRKGTLRPDLALGQMGRNILANLAKLVRPEPWIDRRGRALGNALGFCDLLRGRLNPRRILDFDRKPGNDV